MIEFRKYRVTTMLYAVLFFAWTTIAHAGSVAMIQDVVNETLSTIVNQDLNYAQARAAFEGLVKRHLDLNNVAHQLLANSKRVDALRDAGLLESFKDFIARHLSGIYATQIQSGKGATVTVSPKTSSTHDPVLGQSMDIVKTDITRPGAPVIQIEWYVLPGQGIVDAKVGGAFRMSLTLRSQYTQLWKSSGENPQAFMTALQSSGLA